MADMELMQYTHTDDILADARAIIDGAREKAYKAINITLVQRNWLLGQRIAIEELKGEDRAEYGAEVIQRLSTELTKEYGKGFTKSNQV